MIGRCLLEIRGHILAADQAISAHSYGRQAVSEQAGIGEPFSQESVAAIRQVIARRCSIRSFASAMPSHELIEEILAAGFAAPYAAAMAPGAALDRRFFVLPRGCAALQAAAATMKAHAVEALGEGELPAPLSARLAPIAQGRILGVGTAPYYVVVAERAGMMTVAQESIAHALENMWLMATALGLGMHLVSVTSMMADDRAFCHILGLPVSEFALNGCAIGVPEQAAEARSLFDVGSVIRWLA
jgi:nitroreductase